MTAQLPPTKEQLEIEKLQLEIHDLKKPWQKKINLWQLVVTGLLTGTSFWILYKTADFTVKGDLLNLTEQIQKSKQDSLDSENKRLVELKSQIISAESDYAKVITKLRKDSTEKQNQNSFLNKQNLIEKDSLDMSKKRYNKKEQENKLLSSQLKKEKDSLDFLGTNLEKERIRLQIATQDVERHRSEAGTLRYNSLCYQAIRVPLFELFDNKVECSEMKQKLAKIRESLSQVQVQQEPGLMPIQ